MATILLVGGGGFVGQHVAADFLQTDHRVYATYRPGSRTPTLEGIHWIPSDLALDRATDFWPDHCDHVLFLAQSRSWRKFPEKAADVFAVNVACLMKAVEYACHSGVRQFIYASTGSVYTQTNHPSLESDPIDLRAPRVYYAASKLCGEVLLRPFESLFRVISLRLFMPYGLGQSSDMLLPSLLRNVQESKAIKLHNPDGLIANPVAVRDVVETIRRSLELDYSATFNVAGPERLTLRNMAATIGRVVGMIPVFEQQPGTPPVIVGDCTALHSALGWSPQISLESGLRQWIESEMIPPRAAG